MTIPEIELSNLYLNLSLEAGTSYDGSFIIYSRNGQELCGKVLSTNDKVVVEKNELSGTECEIPFYFKGKMAIPGEEHSGDFLLLTNAGEYNIPYNISVVSKKMRVLDLSLANLNEFRDFARENWEKAKEVFFTTEFHDVFFASKDEYHDLYHSLLKGQSKDVILDNFLLEATGKKKARIEILKEDTTVPTDGPLVLPIHLNGWGHIEGRVYCKHGYLNLSKEHFWMDDFENHRWNLEISIKEGKYEDILVIDTVYQRIERKIKAEVAGGFRPPALLKKKKEILPVLLRLFVELRTGMIELEEYIGRSLAVLPEKGNFFELYRFLLSVLEQSAKEDGDAFVLRSMAEEIEEKRTVYLNDSECRSFYYYLMSLYKKDRASLMEAAIQIKDCFEKKQGLYDYLFLIMVDKNYALDLKGQCKILGDFIKNGQKSPLCYLALLDLLNREPYYLEHLKGIRSDLMLWALKHQYVSVELSRQFANMVLKEKYFSKKYLDILLRLYELKKEDIYLKAICSVCIKGNKTDEMYHPYFETALEKDIKIVGLNEYYLRTLDFSSYPELPNQLLYYFHYSNSLDKREKAYLYANIVFNKEKYEEVWPNYWIRIEEFVREQMMEGRMNRYLLYLYEQMLPELLKNKDLIKYLPNILFKKKLFCPNSMMEGVYVSHDERDEVYVPLVDGMGQIEIFSDQVDLYFVDSKANRYHFGIDYEILPYLNEEEYRELCMKYNNKNKKVVMKWLDPLEEGRVSYLFQENDGVRGWRRERTIERILDSHYEEKAWEDLSKCLDQINYRIINPSYRRTLMNYYMACNRMEDAYFGAELYGSDQMDISQLYLLTCVGLYLHKEEKDDLLLVMAHKSFIGGKYNKEILMYLRMHFEGRSFDLMTLWEALKREGLDTVEFEERMLNQMMLTRERDEGMLDVLLSYLEKRENDALTVSLLEVYSIYYFLLRKQVPDSYFAILSRQAGRENGLSFMGQLSYLLHKAESGFTNEEMPYIKKLVHFFTQRHIVFDFFEKFEDFVSISPLLKEMTAFYCYGNEQMELRLSYVTESPNRESRIENITMEELCPGFYYGRNCLLADEKIKETRVFHFEEEIQSKIMMCKMDCPIKNSRYELLYQMGEQSKQAGKIMEQYKAVLSRMGEQFKILT